MHGPGAIQSMAKSKLGQRAKVLESTCDCTLSIFKLIIVLKYPDSSDLLGDHCDPRSTEVSCKNLRNWNCLPCLSPLSVRTGQRLVASIPNSQKLRFAARFFQSANCQKKDIFIRIPVAGKFNPTIVSIWMYMGVSKHGGIHKIGGLSWKFLLKCLI